MKTFTTTQELQAAIKDMAQGMPVLWGTGNVVYTPHVQVVNRYGVYNVTISPNGNGYMAAGQTHHTLTVSK